MTEVEILKLELIKALAEIDALKLQLSNVTLLLKKEMHETGKLPIYVPKPLGADDS